jgi:D-alanyl-D-alanine carboxypeptidase
MSRAARLRYLRRLAHARAVHRQSRIQNELSEAWSAAQAAPSYQTTNGAAGGPLTTETEPRGNAAATPSPVTGSSPAASDLTLTEEELALNPLVLAFEESLLARGYSADHQGFIVESMNGGVLAEHNADVPFNPASVVKIATSLVAIARLGADYRFRTVLYTDGTVDPSTQTLNGSLYVVGSGDPAFCYENAMLLADHLNRNGIHEVKGNLIVQGQFYFNFSTSREDSAKNFRNALSPETWTAEMKKAYPRFLSMRSAENAYGGRPAPHCGRPQLGPAITENSR